MLFRRPFFGGRRHYVDKTLLVAACMLPLVTATSAVTYSAESYWTALPSQIPDKVLPQPSIILAADGTKIATLYSENRQVVASDAIPDLIKNALVAIEDARFYEHGALDVQGVLRAVVNNFRGRPTQGGSTLTQQYAKNLLLLGADTPAERAALTSQTSYGRKLRELRYAVQIEKTQTKDDILTGYLNAAYFGDSAYGIAAAAKHYFSKELADLDIAEAALLVGLVQRPTFYAPTTNPDGAVNRRNQVLAAMEREGYITGEEQTIASAAPIALKLSTPKNGCISSAYPYFCQYVRRVFATDPTFGATPEERQNVLYKGGMTIRTTLDRKKQKIAQQAVDEGLGRDNRVATATVTITPGTGQVTAMAQNRTFGRDKKENETQIILGASETFQPGSAFKPITLAAAISDGYNLSTVEYIPAVYYPPNMNAPKGGFTNSTAGASGYLTAAQGLWRSSNTFFVFLEHKIGIPAVKDMAEKLGYSELKNVKKRDASFTLGTEETSVMKMANVYATLAAHGKHCNPIVITSITTATGDVPAPPANCRQVIRSGVADTVANIMAGVIDGPDPLRTGKKQTIGRPAAGKTGTTENNASVWFVGFTPQNSTAVWVGDPRGPKYPLRNFYAHGQFFSRGYGGLVAGPIWKQIMLGIHDKVEKVPFTAADPSVTTGYVFATPDVRGLTVAAATQALQQAGLTVVMGDMVDGEPVDEQAIVQATQPQGGEKTPNSRTVTLVTQKR